MITVSHNDKNNSTTAVIHDCTLDAVNRIQKRFNSSATSLTNNLDSSLREVPNVPQATMHRNVVGVSRLSEGDTYEKRVGEENAISKALSNYNTQFRKALKRWQVATLMDIYRVSPETFDDAINTVQKRLKK